MIDMLAAKNVTDRTPEYTDVRARYNMHKRGSAGSNMRGYKYLARHSLEETEAIRSTL